MKRSVILLAFALAATAPAAAEAQIWGGGDRWQAQQDQAREGVRQGRLVPLGRVLDQIRRRVGGRQLDASLEQGFGRPVYRVRWAADDGRRIDFIVDAETGQILSSNG